ACRHSLTHAAEAQAGAQKALRVHRFAGDPRLIVQMRAGRATGRAHASDDLAGAHALAFLDVDRGKVAVAGREPVAMVDLDHLAVAAAPPRLDDGAGGRGADRL